QLIGGRELALDAGDPRPILDRLSIAGEVAVIDLDAALGQGDNAALIRELCRSAPCRVGGGIRSVEAAVGWLDAGAEKVILGTAAHPEILRHLPRARTIAALDAVDGEVVVDGWRTRTGTGIAERMAALRPYVGGFLVTFVEREGRMGGTAAERVPALVEAAGDAQLTIAGGVTTAEEVGALDRLGADAQVGMALYTGRMQLGDAIAATLRSDRPDGRWPTIVCDERGAALGLAYSDAESLRVAVAEQRGVYSSRRRGLWRKGASSGDTQTLRRVQVDCDRDALRFVVSQHGGGFCHTGSRTCFGADGGLSALARTVAARRVSAPEDSYTARLFEERGLLGAKLREEAAELAEALESGDRESIVGETADVLYFALAALAKSGVPLAAVEAELDRRARRITRRRGDAKPEHRGEER
ncbi:MAG: phosphoribosyl-ATP pyrophosphohydrolase/phosphoribosyl-AMP cyclohydrolase, partial [Myxococcota bacterium]